MTTYHLRSPSGRVLHLYAASIYHAIQQAELASRTGLGIATIKRAEDARLWMNMKQFLIICNTLKLPALNHISFGVKKPRRR